MDDHKAVTGDDAEVPRLTDMDRADVGAHPGQRDSALQHAEGPAVSAEDRDADRNDRDRGDAADRPTWNADARPAFGQGGGDVGLTGEVGTERDLVVRRAVR